MRPKQTGKPKGKRGRPGKDLPGLYQWPLDPRAWDFRKIPPDEVKVAIFYEYACSCDWLRLLWQAWLAKPFPSWKTVRLARGLVDTAWDYQKTQPVSAILWKHYQNGVPRFGQDGHTAITEQLVASIPSLLRGSEFEDILFAVPAFPTPWLALDTPSKERLKKQFAVAYYKDRAFSVFEPSEPIAAYRQNSSYQNRIFETVIDWTTSEKRIVADFKKWLAPQYKRFGHSPKGQQGLASSDKYERLRWLTAWRLHRAGLTHRQAQDILQERIQVPSPNRGHDLPLVPDKGSWRNFHTRARKECQDLFPLRS
jgi:hypothetical protein